jgi:hypothetical protein
VHHLETGLEAQKKWPIATSQATMEAWGSNYSGIVSYVEIAEQVIDVREVVIVVEVVMRRCRVATNHARALLKKPIASRLAYSTVLWRTPEEGMGKM